MPIIVNEPNSRFIRLKITAEERADAEADLLLRAGGVKFVATWVAVFVIGTLWAARYWIGWAH